MSRGTTPLTRFLKHSPCPYARRASVLHVGPWRDSRPTSIELDGLADRTRALVTDASADLIALEVQGADRIAGVGGSASLVHALLAGLRERDFTDTRALTAGITDPDWDFEFEGHAFFVSLFAPFYPPDHSRWSGEPDAAFVLLQPESSFRRFSVSSKRPGRRALSEGVHRRFAAYGQSYDLDLTMLAPKALRYVKPIALGDAPLRWWEAPY